VDQRLVSTFETVKRNAAIGAERARDFVQFSFAVAEVWGGRAGRVLWRAARLTLAFLKRAGLQALALIERALLSHAGRERIQATAVFALIIALAVTSIDYLITGGPEFNINARATPYVSQANLIAPRSRDAGIELAMLETPAPAPAAAAAEERAVEPGPRHVEAPAVGPAKSEPERVADAERDKSKPEHS
jgi:hypothetical protein